MEADSSTVAAATHTALGQLVEFAVRFSFSIAGALVLLVGGWMVAGMVSRAAYRGFSRIHGVDETLARFVENMVYYILLMIALMMVLGQFGVQTTSIIAAIGAAGLAIGLALQGTLQNIAAGIMLLILRPMRLGEYIETGSVKGYVREIGLFATRMETADGHYLMAPNSTLWNTPITNHSRSVRRRQELSVAIDNDADSTAIKLAILNIVRADTRVQTDPAPRVYFDDLTANSTVLSIEYWAKTSDWSETRHDMIDKLKSELVRMEILLK